MFNRHIRRYFGRLVSIGDIPPISYGAESLPVGVRKGGTGVLYQKPAMYGFNDSAEPTIGRSFSFQSSLLSARSLESMR